MTTPHDIKNVRQTLNAAQDKGQECLVLVRRATLSGPDTTEGDIFENEAGLFAIAAWHNATLFVHYAKQLTDSLTGE